jgi:hypothetical protein
MRITMRLRPSAALAAIAAAALVVAAWPADAQTQKKPRKVYAQTQTRVVGARAPARVTVQRRSYLDAGTEVLPGERKFTDYAIPPNYTPLRWADPFGGWDRQPLPSPWDLPGSRGGW